MNDVELRLWSRVDKSGRCWTWIGGRSYVESGALKIDGQTVSARRLAWRLTMGREPDGNLVSACGTPACLRPAHMWERGERRPTANQIAPKAGWPFQFRDGFANEMVRADEAESELLPLLLYRGSMSLGRAQALFNLTLAAQHLGLSTGQQRSGVNRRSPAGRLVSLTREYPDLSHSVGLHGPLSANASMPRFWWRLADNPATLDLRPGLREFVEEALANSPNYIFPLDRISATSYWSTRPWRRATRPTAATLPMPEVWPFLPVTIALSDADLIRRIDDLVPKTLPEIIRQEVCQDLVLAVLEDAAALDELRGEPGEFIRDVFRRYPIKYGPMSLDAPIGGGFRDNDDLNLGAFLAFEELIA